MMAFTKKGQKRYQIAASYFRTGSCGAAAAENMCTYNTARNIVDKFLTTGLFDSGGRGSPQTIMQPWKVAYLEALVTYDPFMYLGEMQKALRDDLNLPAAEIPSIPTICRTLISTRQQRYHWKGLHLRTELDERLLWNGELLTQENYILLMRLLLNSLMGYEPMEGATQIAMFP